MALQIENNCLDSLSSKEINQYLMLFYLEVDIIPLKEPRMDKCINTDNRADSIASQHNSIFFI